MDSQRPDLSGVQLAEQLTDWFWQPVPISVSEIGSGQSNFYEYCLNDPVNRIDPSGLQALPLTKKVVDGLNNLYWFGTTVHNIPGEAAGIFWVDKDELNENGGDVSKCELNFELIGQFFPYTEGERPSFPIGQFLNSYPTYYPDRVAVGIAHTHPVDRTTEPTWPADYSVISAFDLYYGDVIVHNSGWYHVEKGMGEGEYNKIKERY